MEAKIISGKPEFATFKDLVEEYLKLNQRLFFIQVGAFDAQGDPILYYMEKYNINGIMIEPNPTPFKRLQHNQVLREITLLNIAISPEEGIRNLYFVPENKADSYGKRYWAKYCSTLVPDRGRIMEFSEDVENIKVECCTLQRVINDHDVKNVDLLLIDTEGHDYEVIKSLDFGKIKPKIIHYEERHIPKDENIECHHFLKEQGYVIFEEPHPNDTTAYLADLFVR